MKPEGTRYQTAMKMKVLSPEIIIVSKADAFHLAEGNSLTVVKRDRENPTGSEAAVWYHRDRMGTRENQGAYQEKPSTTSDTNRNKPINGKNLTKVFWLSDYSIVSMKSYNGDGEKGVAGMRWTAGTHLPPLEAETRC